MKLGSRNLGVWFSLITLCMVGLSTVIIVLILALQQTRIQEKSLNRTVQETQRRIEQKNNLLLDFITNISGEPLKNYNFDILKSYVESAVKDKNVLDIVFFDSEEDALTKRRLETVTPDIVKLQSDVVAAGGERLGRVEIYFNKESLHEDIERLKAEHGKNLRDLLLVAVNTSVVMGVFLVVALLVIFRRLVAARLEVMVRGFERIGQGDLTERLDLKSANRAAHDEIDRLIDGYNTFIERISELFLQIRSATDHFADGAQEIAASAQKVAQGAQQQTTYFNGLTDSIDRIATSVTAASAIAKASEENAEKTSESMNTAIDAISEIEKSSNKISEAVTIITDIADQTNLLALNASIEAARAGEHGKGFAVVADEVRKLAERSTVSAKEISGLVSQSLTQVSEGVRLSKGAGNALQGIVANMTKVAEQLSSVKSITLIQIEDVKENTSIVESNAAAAEQMSASSEEFSVNTETLKRSVRQFKFQENAVKETGKET